MFQEKKDIRGFKTGLFEYSGNGNYFQHCSPYGDPGNEKDYTIEDYLYMHGLKPCKVNRDCVVCPDTDPECYDVTTTTTTTKPKSYMACD